MTIKKFLQIVRKYKNGMIKLEWKVARIALKNGWIYPVDVDLICSRKFGNRYFLNIDIMEIWLLLKNEFSESYISGVSGRWDMSSWSESYISGVSGRWDMSSWSDSSSILLDRLYSDMAEAMAKQIDEEILNSFLDSTSNIILNV